ncbi:vWA domain-containing protein [Pseudogemmobacter sonorensis]|uniref:vWA domain-containing protein n=1 Tax=Pseudogemmobacter sonorensis TaxID=2989681 RepID=UPI0036C6F18E
MTDEFEALRSVLRAAPAPDAAARDRALAQAMENFDRLQALAPETRPKEDRPGRAGLWNGVLNMLEFLSRKPALAATTSVAALVVGLAVFLPQGGRLMAPTPAADPVAAAGDAGSGTAGAGGAALTEAARTEAAMPEAEVAELATAELLPAEPGLAETAPMELAVAADQAAPALAREAAPALAPPIYAPPVPAMPPMAEAAPAYLPDPGDEAYPEAAPNPVRITAEEPVSTFSADVDTASWAVIRSTLGLGVLPAPEQVRIEEMVNYFPYDLPAPEDGAAFRASLSVMPTPWNADTRLVTVALQGALPEVAARPPLNLVFLIDTSGSMEAANKLPLLRQSLALMLPELRPEDQVAIVTYAGSAGVALEPTAASDRATILAALDNLTAGGGTAGAAGLELAYLTAERMAGEGEVSRILLATDGDFNLGLSDPAGLTDYVAAKRDSGSYLSVLGFGRGNLDDAVMQALAQNGNGTAAYIDTLSEARKVLVDQLTGALFPIADDVKVQVEWNPATVAEYRLIGYETRALRREDFSNDKIDAGEIGAGLQVTAIYEVTAPGSPALLNEPLRYGPGAEAAGDPLGELGFLRLRWKTPGEDRSQLAEVAIIGTESAGTEARFAAAIAGFGQLLTGGTYLGGWGYDEAIALALENRGEDAFGYRIEAVNLMRLAQTLAR